MTTAKKKRGSAAVLVLVCLSALLGSFSFAVNVGKYFHEKTSTDVAAEAIALSLATWEARHLNISAALNEATVSCIKGIRLILMKGAVSVGLAVHGNFGPIFRFSREGRKAVKKLWSLATKYSSLNRKVRKTYPLVLAESLRELCSYYDVKGIPFPLISGSKGKGNSSLILPVVESPNLEISGSIRAAIRKARSYKPRNPFKKKLFKVAYSLFERILRAFFSLKGHAFLQVPARKAEELGKIHILAVSREKSPFLSSFYPKKYRTWSVAAATVIPGDVFKPTWKSRLTEVSQKAKNSLLKSFSRGRKK
ncbi:MAG: hypothetical protein D6713_10395 [Deltaproteobacteria bacterium]|nr:MAG: hypothetical protein D6713_10395 [Deltaproteobacteria bacterium]